MQFLLEKKKSVCLFEWMFLAKLKLILGVCILHWPGQAKQRKRGNVFKDIFLTLIPSKKPIFEIQVSFFFKQDNPKSSIISLSYLRLVPVSPWLHSLFPAPPWAWRRLSSPENCLSWLAVASANAGLGAGAMAETWGWEEGGAGAFLLTFSLPPVPSHVSALSLPFFTSHPWSLP